MTDWMKQRDLLMEEALAFAQSVAANTQKMALTPVHQPDAADDFALSVQRPIAAKEPASQDKPDTEGAIIRKRLENFRANQERFRREREEYCTTTMAKARATSGHRKAATTGIEGVFALAGLQHVHDFHAAGIADDLDGAR